MAEHVTRGGIALACCLWVNVIAPGARDDEPATSQPVPPSPAPPLSLPSSASAACGPVLHGRRGRLSRPSRCSAPRSHPASDRIQPSTGAPELDPSPAGPLPAPNRHRSHSSATTAASTAAVEPAHATRAGFIESARVMCSMCERGGQGSGFAQSSKGAMGKV